MAFTPPPLRSALPVADVLASWPQPWANWLMQLWGFVFDLQNSGTTAQRPTTNLYVGKVYFDTTLVYPIWWDGSQWVDATGTPAP